MGCPVSTTDVTINKLPKNEIVETQLELVLAECDHTPLVVAAAVTTTEEAEKESA